MKLISNLGMEHHAKAKLKTELEYKIEMAEKRQATLESISFILNGVDNHIKTQNIRWIEQSVLIATKENLKEIVSLKKQLNNEISPNKIVR